MSKKTKPVEQPDVTAFDYENLNGDHFKDYQKLLASLNAYDSYDFEQFMASGIFEKDFNKQTGSIDTILTGIRLNRSQSINTTRMPLIHIMDLNRQIENRSNPPTNSRYYLLKKVAKEETEAA